MNNIDDSLSVDLQDSPAKVILASLNDDPAQIDELAGLVRAAGGEVVATVLQNRDKPDAATYIGEGKAEEISRIAETLDADLVVIDDELSGSTLRNLADRTDCRVIDRTALILDIFATRSRTALSKAQVELAQLEYRRSRLTGLGSALSQQGGGIGTRGPGETKLEQDRRKIDRRIYELRKLIRSQAAVLETQRKRRQDSPQPIVALVGYTNAGKSSILNWFLERYEAEGGEVFERDMLFATLDTFLRRIELDENRVFLLADTVGFVSRLPHQLVEAFQATLEEVRRADLLIHVLDGSSEHVRLQADSTEEVLREIHAENVPRLTVLNKCDLKRCTDEIEGAMPVSARSGEGMDELVRQIDRMLFGDRQLTVLFFPFAEAAEMSRLLAESRVRRKRHDERGTYLTVVTNRIQRGRYRRFIVERDPLDETDG